MHFGSTGWEPWLKKSSHSTLRVVFRALRRVEGEDLLNRRPSGRSTVKIFAAGNPARAPGWQAAVPTAHPPLTTFHCPDHPQKRPYGQCCPDPSRSPERRPNCTLPQGSPAEQSPQAVPLAVLLLPLLKQFLQVYRFLLWFVVGPRGGPGKAHEGLWGVAESLGIPRDPGQKT